ncbi:GL12505 [Drosophila persimilis]|uniref:GL12505 n=1 Tax=Drosophila persimilis TaxID=7234 RepID=B4GL55_DROPE|nr:GL12505 [Drosophila persimilis]
MKNDVVRWSRQPTSNIISSNSTTSSSRSRSNRSHNSRSALVFICNFNVGFVAGSVASASSPAPTPAPPSLKVDAGQSPVLPPYVLDYETGGRAKLTPSNGGKYGNSGGSSSSSSGGGSSNNAVGHYTHTWAVHIPSGDNGNADAVARDHGFVNLGKMTIRACKECT